MHVYMSANFDTSSCGGGWREGGRAGGGGTCTHESLFRDVEFISAAGDPPAGEVGSSLSCRGRLEMSSNAFL